jgi:two-component system, chemotaxis family, sensor kinase CheA
MAFWNRNKPETVSSADERSIFLQEEFKGEDLINYIRIAIIFILEFTTLAKFDVFGHFQVSITLIVTTIMLGTALVYSIVLLFLFRNNIYHPVIKYIGAIINMTLVILSIAVYRLEPYSEYSQISQLARYSIIFLLYLFTILNYNVRVAIFAGIVATLEYFFFVVYGNYFSNLSYTFLGADGVQYTSQFKTSEQALKLIYVFVGGAVAAVVAGRLRNLVRRVIAEQKETVRLEKERQKLVEAVNVENRKYLENVSDGLVLIDRDFVMREQYSKAFVEIFNDDRIAGRNIVDFFFPDAKKQANERKELLNFLTILFNNDTADIDMILDINPMRNKPVLVKGNDGTLQQKIIQVDFKRIFAQDNTIENIMAIVEDRTRAIETQLELTDEKSKREEELDMIQTILRLSPATLSDFFGEAAAQLHHTEALLAGKPGREKIDEAFREIHSLRGTSRTLGFRTLSEIAQKVEYYLAQVRDDYENSISGFSISFLNQFDALNEELDKIRGLFDRFKYFVNLNLRERNENLSSQLEEFLNLLKNMTKELSRELGKEIVFRYSKSVDGLPFLAKIRNPLIHLIRNSIDHGIEDTYERLSKGKMGFGIIRLNLELADGNYTIDVQDNGRGIDFEKIRKKAIEKNLFPPDKTDYTENDLIRFIFLPGFSSMDLHTDISGSGVGLDIVKESVKKLGGTILVSTKKDKGTRFRIIIPATPKTESDI